MSFVKLGRPHGEAGAPLRSNYRATGARQSLGTQYHGGEERWTKGDEIKIMEETQNEIRKKYNEDNDGMGGEWEERGVEN
jgi:hypothetical protein